jgi:hypothetical protein
MGIDIVIFWHLSPFLMGFRMSTVWLQDNHFDIIGEITKTCLENALVPFGTKMFRKFILSKDPNKISGVIKAF